MANISAARFVEKPKSLRCSVFTTSPPPEAVTSFRSVLAELGLSCRRNKPEPRDYAELLESISDRPDAEMLQTMLLRSMKQAIYDPENRGHFGLAYSRTRTLPRRSAVIRICPCTVRLKYLLAHEQGHKGNTTENGGYHYSMEEMLQLVSTVP